MKIVLTIHHVLSKDAGAPGVVLSYAREFLALGHDVTVLSHEGMGNLPGKLRVLLFPLYVAWTLLRHHRDADVIDASSGDAWIYFNLMGATSRTLFVGHSHGLADIIHNNLMKDVAAGRATISWKYPLFNGTVALWQDGETFRAADLSLFLNRSDRDYAVGHLRVPATRAKVVPNGVSAAYLEKAAKVAHRENPPRTRIVQVGNYLERKGVQTTAAALIPLMQELPELQLTFLGTCQDAQNTLRDYPEELRERIHVVPFFDNETLPDLLAQQDIFLLPSRSEGFPLAPMEAMACGVVPIVTDIPGPTEYIFDRQNGMTIPVGDAEALATCIRELVSDAALYGRLQAAAVETASHYPWNRIAEDRLALYREFREKKLAQG